MKVRRPSTTPARRRVQRQLRLKKRLQAVRRDRRNRMRLKRAAESQPTL